MRFIGRSSLLSTCVFALLVATAPAANAQVSAAPATVDAPPGSTSQLVTVTITIGRGDPINGELLFSGLPAGVTTIPSPVTYTLPPSSTTGTTSFQFDVGPSTIPGSYPVQINASGTAGTAFVTLNVVQPGDLAVSLANPIMTVCAGAAPAVNSATLAPIGSYSGTPALQWIGVPADVTITPATQVSPPLPPAQTLAFSLSTLPTASGTRTVTLLVSDPANGIQKSATLTLQIIPPSFAPSIAPSSITLLAGGAATSVAASITPNACLTEPVTISTSGVPTGVSFAPPSAVMNAPYVPQTFSISAAAGAPAGTTTVTFRFTTPSGLQQTATLAITVLAPPDFSIAASPASLTITAGQSGQTQLSLIPLNGFTGSANVVAVADPDLTVTPPTFSLAASAPQIVQIAVAPGASPHVATIMFQAQAPGVNGVRTASVTVNISPRPDFALTVSPAVLSIRSGTTATVQLQVAAMNGFQEPVSVTAPVLPGVSFSPSAFVLAPGATQIVTIDATQAGPVAAIDLVFTGTAAGFAPRTAHLSLTILARDPRLTAISPPATVAGAVEQRFRVIGEFLQTGAAFAFDDPRVRIVSAIVLGPQLAELVITTNADTPAGAYVLRVTNPDGGRSATGVPLLVYPPTSLAAPLGITAAAIVFPGSGSSVANEESVYPRGLLATSGAGTIIGSWQLDGVPFDRFTAIVSGGLPVEVRAHVPIPTTFAGGHQLQLVIESPSQLAAPAIEIVQTTVRASRLTLYAPRDGAVLPASPSLFRWSLVPNCAGYLVEVMDDAIARTGVPPALLPVHRFRVSNAEWRPSADELRVIGFGVRRWRVSPVCAGETIAEPTRWNRVAFLPDTVTLTIAPIGRGPNGSLLVRWSGAPAGLLYRVEVLSAEGNMVFATLTARTEIALDRKRFDVPAGGSVRVTAFGPGGAILGTSAAVTMPQSTLRNPHIQFAQLTNVTNVQTEPREGARVTTTNPRVSAAWREALRPDQISMMLDATDVTFVSTVTPTSIVYDALLPLEPGPHTARLSLAGQLTSWTFNVEPEQAAATPEGTAPPQQEAKKSELRKEWVVSPVGAVTLVRDQNDEARLRVSAQTDLAGAATSMKVNGDIGIKHEIDDPQRTIQESRSWVTQFGADQKSVSEELTVGYTQPDFMDQAELVSAGLARGGAQAKVKTRAGTLSYYQTFGTRPVGVVAGNIGPEQRLRAMALRLPQFARWDFRIIALNVDDEPGFNSAGGDGRAYGLFGRYAFAPAASVIVEAARGRFRPNAGSAVEKREGDAFRVSFTGAAAGTSYALNLRHTDSNFVNPANRGFTAGGIPDRTGGDLALSRLFGRTSVSAQARYLRNGTSSGQLVPSASERGGVLSLSSALGAHLFMSLSGNLTEQRGDAAPALSLPKTDRRQSGVNATFSETAGVFTTSQTFQWQKLEDAVTALAGQTIKAATITAAGAFHPNFNLSAVLSGTRSQGAPAIGRTDQVLASLQPMINIPRMWLSLQPRAMWGRTESSLTRFETRTEQYAALLTLSPPVGRSVLALQLSADWNRNRVTGQLVEPPFTRRYVATISLARSLGNLAAPSTTPLTIPYVAPSDPRSGMTSSAVVGGVR